jgi:hypothetical protein
MVVMGCVTRVNEYRDWVLHCEVRVMESGKQLLMFWRDRTFHNLFERMAFQDKIIV